MQAFGLLAVVFAAVGCQYFVFCANQCSQQVRTGCSWHPFTPSERSVCATHVVIDVRAAKEQTVVVLKRVLDKVHVAGQTFQIKIKSWRHSKPPRSDGVALTSTNQPSSSAVFLMPAHSE